MEMLQRGEQEGRKLRRTGSNSRGAVWLFLIRDQSDVCSSVQDTITLRVPKLFLKHADTLLIQLNSSLPLQCHRLIQE